jgi:TRAP-type C4-dicarboxylate transport system permease small subunit
MEANTMSVSIQNSEKGVRLSSVDGIDKYIRLIANWFVWIAMFGFAAMTIVTVIDVIGSKFFHFPFPGGFEITSLIAVVMIVFALPYTQSKKGHIEVELLVERFPKRTQIVIATIMCLISTGLFALTTWQMFKKAAGLLSDGNTTAVLFIPIFPFAFASTLCFFLLFLLILLELIKLIRKVARNG